MTDACRGYILLMIGHLPPFALGTPTFRFRGVAAHAGRASLGGDREVALACFVAARLGAGLLPPLALMPPEAALRAAAARQWLASLSVSAQVRAAAGSVMDATAGANDVAAARALANLLLVAAPHLDEAAFSEMRELIDELAHDSTEFQIPEGLRR